MAWPEDRATLESDPSAVPGGESQVPGCITTSRPAKHLRTPPKAINSKAATLDR